MFSENLSKPKITSKVNEILDSDIAKKAKQDINSGVEKSLDVAKYWSGIASGENSLTTATDKSIALAEYWTSFGIDLARGLVHKSDSTLNPKPSSEENNPVPETSEMKQTLKTANADSDDIVNDAIADITTGIQKSLELAQEWTNVALQKNDIKTASDKSLDLAQHWTWFGLNLTKQIVHKGLSVGKQTELREEDTEVPEQSHELSTMKSD